MSRPSAQAAACRATPMRASWPCCGQPLPPSAHALEGSLRLVQLRLQARHPLRHRCLECSQLRGTAAAASRQRSLHLPRLHCQPFQLSGCSPQVQLGHSGSAGQLGGQGCAVGVLASHLTRHKVQQRAAPAAAGWQEPGSTCAQGGTWSSNSTAYPAVELRQSLGPTWRAWSARP